MGKGSWRRPTGPSFGPEYDRIFGRKPSPEAEVTDTDTRERHLVLSLDELRTIVFRTSVAYARDGSIQEREWSRAAALKDALADLGFARESEMIGGAG